MRPPFQSTLKAPKHRPQPDLYRVKQIRTRPFHGHDFKVQKWPGFRNMLLASTPLIMGAAVLALVGRKLPGYVRWKDDDREGRYQAQDTYTDKAPYNGDETPTPRSSNHCGKPAAERQQQRPQNTELARTEAAHESIPTTPESTPEDLTSIERPSSS